MQPHQQPDPRVIRIDGRECAYWRYGQAESDDDAERVAVVLVHGFRGDHHGLESIAHGVSSAPIFIPDVPGFGLSEPLLRTPEDQSSTLDALGAWLTQFVATVHQGPTLIVGHSFGTLIVAAALQKGCRADRVILINPISSPALSGPRALLSQLTLQYYRLAARLPDSLGNKLLKSPLIVRGMSEIMAKTREPELRAWIHSQHGAYFSSFRDRDALIHLFEASISHTVFDYREHFRVPTTIVAGDRDDITPLTAQLALAKALPNARLMVIPEVGHLIHYEHPKLVSELAERVITEIDSPTQA